MRIGSYMVVYYTNAGLNRWFNETRGCSYLCSVDTNTSSGWRANARLQGLVRRHF